MFEYWTGKHYHLIMLEFFSLVVVVVVSSVLGLFIFFNNPKSATNKAFVFFAASIIFWAVIMYLTLHPPRADQTLFYIRLSMLAAILMSTAVLFLSHIFPEKKFYMRKRYFVPILIIAAAGMVTAMSPYMFTHLVIDGNNIEPVTGPGMIMFLIAGLGYTLTGIAILVKKFVRSAGKERSQIGYLLLGITLMHVLLIGANFVAVLVFGTSEFISFGPFFTLAFLVSTAYAILRHNLLDIRLLVARTVSYTILVGLLIAGYTNLLFGLTQFFPGETGQQAISVILALVVAFSFNPLRNFLEIITSRFFFKGRYDSQKLLAALTKIMASEIDIGKLSDKLLTELTTQMRLTKGAFLIVDEHKVIGVEAVAFDDIKSLQNNDWEKLLHKNKSEFVYEDLKDEPLKEMFKDLGVAFAMPLKVKENEMGLLVLGNKQSGEVFSGQDIDVLEIFGPEAAVALQNAESYREIQEFSKVLEGKVDERTRELKESQNRELDKQKELLRIKDEFVFIATHDLRTPVTAIKGFVRLIEQDKSKLPNDVLEDFEAISQSSDRLNQLVNDLLQVARSDSGTITVDVEPVDVVGLIKKTEKQASLAAKEKGVKVETEFDHKNKMVMADSEKLAEVMENLISNAIKYNKDNGKVTIETAKEESSLLITVADTGLGIPKDKQAEIFTKFFRAHQAGTENVTGTGLGLFVVRMLVEKMRGTIDFKSEDGKGTTFYLKLPLAKSKTSLANDKES